MNELSQPEKLLYANKVIDWYFEKSKEKKTEEKVELILQSIKLENESNLRTIRYRIRSVFYEVNKKMIYNSSVL